LCASGYSVDLSAPFYVGNVVATSHLLWSIKTAELDNVENLAHRFKTNSRVGAIVTASIIAGSIL
jgi:4-hydroxybenzoate polyprenyltransferase